jgi:hypothetical protein
MMRVRRLLAGELTGAERERTEQHVEGCARCRAARSELEAEREALRRDVPFPAFAAGVAEKLAAQRKPRVAQWTAFAAAAAALIVAGAFVLRPADTERVRSKGAASAHLFVQDSAGVHEVSRHERLPDGARLRISLSPSGRKFAAAVLIEPSETSVLYKGPAVSGPLPDAFEWTGKGSARLRVIFADVPVDPNAPPKNADVMEIVLHR